MRENLVLDLREAADKWRANHPAVMTFEIRYDLALCEAADAIEELQGRAKVLEKVADKWCEAVPKWIPVTERLPENEVTVLVVRKFLGIKDCPAKTYVETAEYCYGDWVADSDDYKIARSKHTDPLYWMPLPDPPKEERR